MKLVSMLCVGAALMFGVTGSALADAATASEGLALQAIQDGKWSEAESELRAGLAQNPSDPKRLLNLAYVLQKAGKADEAASIYAQVLQLDRDPLVAVGSDSSVRPMRAKIIAKKGMAALER